MDSSYVMCAVRPVVPAEPAAPGTVWSAALVLVPVRVMELGLGVVAVAVVPSEHDFLPLDWAVAVVVGVVLVGTPVGVVLLALPLDWAVAVMVVVGVVLVGTPVGL